MPALFFPNLNALRIALTSGLVPDEISHSHAEAGFDSHGRLWLEPAELLPRDSLVALSRLGVQALGGTGVPTTTVDCWAELLPLLPANETPTGNVLFLVHEKQLARFVSRLQRKAPTPYGLRLSEDTDYEHAWVVVSHPPAGFITEAREPDPAFEAFTQQAPRVWVQHGLRHPVPEHLTVPGGAFLLVRATRSVMAVFGELPLPELDEFALPAGDTQPAGALPMAPPVHVRMTLAPLATPGRESLWVLNAEQQREFWALCARADASLASRLEAAPVVSGATTRLVVRVAVGRPAVTLPLGVAGFSTESRVPGLFVPAGRALRPTLRVRELARACGVRPGVVAWVEPARDGGIQTHTVAESAFRPVLDLIEYNAPPVTRLYVGHTPELFPLGWFAAESDALPIPEQPPRPFPIAPVVEEPLPEPEATPAPDGWLRRSLRKLVTRLRQEQEPEEPNPDPAHTPEAASLAGPHVERLASPDALLHGHDWSARRRDLEAGIFHDLPKLSPTGRGERWAELAAVYSATGNATDAAVCWMNAVWESSSPPASWLEQWLIAEARSARILDPAAGIERWLSEPGRPGVGRFVAAYTAAVGLSSAPPVEFLGVLPRLLSFLEQHFDDVPVRAVWLARYAAARVCDGDALGLARWRDRVLARLAERGPGLDLDEPSFLRFHGTASAERFQAAREWLIRSREAALNWIQKQAGGKLRWAGLDPETECTAAYAQFMFAWGIGCLGERTRAKDWAGKARKVVSRVTGPGVEAAAHAVLGDIFLLRVRDAQEGRTPKQALPAELQERLDALQQLARYSVDRLREHSQILEPIERVRAFHGLDLKAVLGGDPLGERLTALACRPDRNRLTSETYDLILLCHESPTTEVVPRVVLTLLDLAPVLDRAALPRVLELLPAALEWTEAWLSAGRGSDSERQARLVRYQTRMLSAGFSAAAAIDPPAPGTLAELVRELVTLGDRMRTPLLAASGQAFRAIRKLGLGSTAEVLVRYLDPAQSGMRRDHARVRLAAGWYTAGNEEAGTRILDEARDVLYLGPAMDTRTRTPLAVAYAETLGFAPARIAHGRLEEIFQRLGPVDGMSSTNSYFTLRPLQLIDAIVRSVVTEEFTLNPSVRGWLDDDEFLIRGRVHRDLAAILREQDIR